MCAHKNFDMHICIHDIIAVRYGDYLHKLQQVYCVFLMLIFINRVLGFFLIVSTPSQS